VTTELGPPALSSQEDNLQRSRDRPLRSWGPYLPRHIPSWKVPDSTAALARLEEPAQQAKPSRAAESQPQLAKQPAPPLETQPESSEIIDPALVITKDDQFEPALQRIAPRAHKPKLASKHLRSKKKVTAERASRKGRWSARRAKRRGVGLFALSRDFGPAAY
jgi:hypothetical protein